MEKNLFYRILNIHFNKYFCEENVIIILKFKISLIKIKKKSISHLVNKYNIHAMPNINFRGIIY